MNGYDASSSDRRSGRLDLRIEPLPATDRTAAVILEHRVRAFVEAVRVGYLFPATADEAAEHGTWADARAVGARLQVRDLPASAFALLAGLLADARHRDGVGWTSLEAVLGDAEIDLSIDGGLRPDAAARPPFVVELPSAPTRNPALLVEIEFADAVAPAARQRLLDELALWSTLCLGFPVDADEPAEAGGAQQHFNDPRTIHHHEWVWDNVDPLAWNLLINLACAWHRARPIVRLHVE